MYTLFVTGDELNLFVTLQSEIERFQVNLTGIFI